MKVSSDYSKSTAPFIKTNSSANNKTYQVAFVGRKDYTENEKAFAAYKAKLSRMCHKADVEESKACWNFYINSTAETQKKYETALENSAKIASDKSILQQLTDFFNNGIKDKNLKKPLDLLLNVFNSKSPYKDDFEKLQKNEMRISQKFNGCRGEVDGKPTPNFEINKLLETERNPEIRKRLYYEVNVKPADLIATDLVDLVKQRNELAHKLGYEDFFSYQLKEVFKVDEKKLFKLLDDLDSSTDEIITGIETVNNKKLAAAYGIKPDELQPYHQGLLLEDNPWPKADKYVKDKDQVISTSAKMYKRMGWDIERQPVILDLFPKPNKNQHGFCFDIDTNKDVRILANLSNDIDSIETLNHELGHAVYDLGISSHIKYFQRNPVSSAYTETIAMMMASIPYKEGTFIKDLNMPQKLFEALQIDKQKKLVSFVRKYLFYINFEKQLYKNPNQDLPKLWFELKCKFQKLNMPRQMDNSWASIPHFLTHPAYMQNYLRAEIMASQIYEAAKNKLGNISENPKTAAFFNKKMFKFGDMLTEEEAIKKISGKELSVTDFCKQFDTLLRKIK